MTNRTAANRYARALLDVALHEKVDPVKVEGELAAFADLFTADETLKKVMLNPAVPAPRKRAATAEIARRAAVTPVVRKLLILLAERDRLVLLPDLLSAYRDRLLDHQKILRAEVTTAFSLDSARAQAIEHRLADVTGRTVRMTTAVDPELIGGVVARLGSTIYDGSVRTQLLKLKSKLAEGS